MKRSTRFLSLLMALLLVFSLVPVLETEADAASGTINLVWPLWSYSVSDSGQYIAQKCEVSSFVEGNSNTYIGDRFGMDAEYREDSHHGVDFYRKSPYDAVVAPGYCKVVEIGYSYGKWGTEHYGAGNYVILQLTDEKGTALKYNNKTIYVRYCHLRFNVKTSVNAQCGDQTGYATIKKNQILEPGTVVGFVGNSGYSSGAHLDMRLMLGGTKNVNCVDPLGSNTNYSFSLHTCDTTTCNDVGYCSVCKTNYKNSDTYKSDRVLFTGKLTPGKGYFFPIGNNSQFRIVPYDAALKYAPQSAVSSVDVVAKAKNHYGEIWYECRVEGKVCYIKEENVDASQIKVNEKLVYSPKFYTNGLSGSYVTQFPSVLQQGTSVYLRGTIASSNTNIVSVSVGIYDRSGNITSYGSSKKNLYSSSSVNSTKFDIATADPTSGTTIFFSKLAAGDYTYKVVATTKYGTTQTWSYDFTVRSKNTPQPLYSVTLNANGGSLGGSSSKSVSVTKGNSIALKSYVPTREGYTFLGWASASGAEEADYSETATYKPTRDIKLYAVWEPIAVPSAPVISRADIQVGAGEELTVQWRSGGGVVESYFVEFFDADGQSCYTATVPASLTSLTTVLNDAGQYTVTVTATNNTGDSAPSMASSITVYAPSNVIFLNYDGSEWSRQAVAYNGSAIAPAEPSRAGYTFAGWDGSLDNVTADRTLTAQYTPVYYTVTFYDFNGNAVKTERVSYNGDTPGSASAPDASLLNIPEGYVLAGWDTDAWQNVTRSGIKVYPCVVWENVNVPISTTINSATEAGSGYWVTYSIENHLDEAATGRVVIVLKSGAGKFLTKTESGAFYLQGLGIYNGSIYVPLNQSIQDESFATVEAYVVDSYQSMVPISGRATKALYEGGDSEWSAWMTAEEYAAYTGDKSETQTRTEYSTRSREVTDWTENSSYLDWDLLDSRTIMSDWGSWSAWQDSSVTATDYKEVQTQQVQTAAAYTQYRYGKYVSTAAGKGVDGDSYSKGWGHFHQGYYNTGYELKYSSWSKTKTNPTTKNFGYWSTNNKVGTGTKSGSKYYWNKYVVSGTTYYWQESRTVAATYKTQYRYRTRTDVDQYRYFMWNDWSDWTTTAATATEELQVQTRTMYRVKLPASESGEGVTIAGTLSIDGITDLEGREAILAIYKVDEASDYSNEYLAQTTLEDNGSYCFENIHTYESPSVKTGDFTVTLTIEGSSGPLVIDTGKLFENDPFKAPKPTYQVKFVDEITGQQIGETQTVTEGGTAIAPDVAEKAGYTFLGWEYGLTNIRDNMTIKARFVPKTYTIVYVDMANSTVSMQTDVPYGSTLTPEDPPQLDGYTFIGWRAQDGASIDSVDRSMIVMAEYEKLSYTVRFLDADGEVIDTQTVEYGADAETPDIDEVLVPENMYLEDWSEDVCAISGAVDVYPVFMYLDDAEYPEANLESGIYVGPQSVAMSVDSDDGTLTYRLTTMDDVAVEEAAVVALDSGSETEENSGKGDKIYTAPIALTQSAVIEVTNHQENANDVTAVYTYTIVPEGSRPSAPSRLVANAFDDSVTLSWPRVTGADGYIIHKSDVYGNLECFMTTGVSYSDTNVTAGTDYTYSVMAYSVYTDDDTETFLISEESSPEASVRFYGDQYAVEQIEIDADETILVGNSIQIYANITPEDAYDRSVVWGVENGTGSAVITDNGVLTAMSAGTISVTAASRDGSGITARKGITIVDGRSGVVSLTVDSAAVKRGNAVQTSVSIGENSGAAAIQMTLWYDSDLLTLSSAAAGNALSSGNSVINTDTPGKIVLSWECLDNELSAAGSVMDVVFTTANVSDSIDTLLAISEQDDLALLKLDKTTIDCQFINGKISILAPNQDATGKVSIGTEYYDSLVDAVRCAEAGGNIMIREDLSVDGVVVDKAVTIVNPGFAMEGEIQADEGFELTTTTLGGVTIYTVMAASEAETNVAKIGRDEYTTVEAAVLAAESGQTVTLVADAIEEKATLLLNEGVTLDLGIYTLKAKALFGADDSYVTGSYYSKEEDHAQLYVSTLKLGETAYYDGKYDVLPVYVPAEDGGYYAFSRFAIKDTDGNYGVVVDESQDTITFSFSQALTGDVRKKLLQDNGSSDNELQIVVDVTYSDDNGSHHHNYIYIDEFVQKVASGNYYYTFTLTGYSNLNIDPETVTIQARAETTSGVTTYGNTFVNSKIVTE